MAGPPPDPQSLHNLTALLPSSTASVAVPSHDSISHVVAQRLRHHLHSTYVGDSTLLVVNPLQVTADQSEASKAEYEDRAYRVRQGRGGELTLPHAYDLACRAYVAMRRTGETQSIVYSGLSGAGSSMQQQLFTAQILRLSSSTKKDTKIADQVAALSTLLTSFGSAKTVQTPSSTRHASLLELHFAADGRLAAAKLLAYGLDKTRFSKLAREERTFHAFYQLLAGASKDEKEQLGLFEDITEYRLLAKSACYRLPPGTPHSDDSIAFDELRAAFKTLAFKPRHVASIFRILAAILVLGNLEFAEHPADAYDFQSEPAWVENREDLDHAASLLGTSSEELERVLTNRVRWARKEMTATILRAEGADQQRDSLMNALYSILFAFIVETANHKLFPGDEAIAALQEAGGSSILQFSQPGFSNRAIGRPGSGLLVRALNGYDDFTANYASELANFWLAEHEFDGDNGIAARAQEDGVRLPDVLPADGSARVELLRGGRIGGKADRKPGGLLGGLAKTCSSLRKGTKPDVADEELLRGMRDHFSSHPAFISTPGGPGARSAFGIQHFAGSVTYDSNRFVETDSDNLDPDVVAMLRASSDGFVAKLFSGPSLAAEVHPLDDNTIVAAQISSSPLRRPSPIRSSPALLPTDIDYTAPLLDTLAIHPVSSQINATLAQLLILLDRTHVWNVISLRPNDTNHPGQVDIRRLREQISAYHLAELTARKKIDLPFDVDYDTFVYRHGLAPSAASGTKETAESYLVDFGFSQQAGDFALGTHRIWLSYRAFKITEDQLRANEGPDHRDTVTTSAAVASGSSSPFMTKDKEGFGAGDEGEMGYLPQLGAGEGSYGQGGVIGDSVDDLLYNQGGAGGPATPMASNPGFMTYPNQSTNAFDTVRSSGHFGGGGGFGQHAHHESTFSLAPPSAPYLAGLHGGSQNPITKSEIWGTDKATPAGFADVPRAGGNKEGVLDRDGKPQEGEGKAIEEIATSRARRIWVAMVWGLTWWVPSVCLTYLGRMKRPDVRMAWREKLALCMLIFFSCGVVIFYIIVFGKLLCPNFDKAWNIKELGYHGGASDYWVGVRGNVYDLTKFYKVQHSDIPGQTVTSELMLELGGLDITDYFPIPPATACPTLTRDQSLQLQFENFTANVPSAIHTSGSLQSYSGSALHDSNWYFDTFLPTMKKYHKGPIVYERSKIKKDADSAGRQWAVVNGSVYDLTDYFYTYEMLLDSRYQFLNSDLANLWEAQPGADLTEPIKNLGLDPTTLQESMDCITTLFYVGEVDFRKSARCQIQPNLLLAFSILIMLTILAKFLAALQFGSKRMPEMRDKFVICQVPCYTEGEESLKKTIDSLAVLNYDDKRKLIFIICDGMIVGSGNDRPTPRIVLDILGVDQTVDPDPLMFKSVAEGSKQLNYGKVWSGLYEVEGHVVPYIVVAKVGRPSERSRPGNRGKRDSQILAMRFLNRVHFDSEMYPLELEMYHQIKNVIGVDPQLYEFMFVIDADTSVAPDSLNRLVAACTDDSQIIGICGETRLENEQDSWWTMIQVYEYFISHHMAKAFESLFGSVTCLPGCFTMYRIRSADKGKPLLVSSLIIDDYSDGVLDTLHKKNLLALGEDRYLTTLILKHFPNYKTKFIADAHAMTVAPHSWSILLSQRRRWINSTVHNLAELMFLPDMCGFCLFGMRFVVFIDLLGTIILPATFVYLVYLIVTVATGSGQIPVIALIMIAAVYGLQAIIFLLKRQWQFIGWLIIYIIAYPVYSFLLPVYSFWKFDDFSWGNTRVVVGEGRSKKVLQAEEEAFDESSIPLSKFSDYEAALAEEDYNYDTRSEKSHSTAGFSLATKLPAGSYKGGPDYYRDTVHTRGASRSTLGFNLPQLPSQGFAVPGAGPGSIHGGYGQGPASVYGGTEFGYGASPYAQQAATYQSQMSLAGLGGPPPPMSALPRRQSGMSAFSFGGNPFNVPAPPAPNDESNPSDELVVAMLKQFLAGQDLMQLSKRQARDGLAKLFPNADFAPRKDFINTQIDAILSGNL
ncbi:uncharacterized protein JCM15063_005776 [Sporobolomyces koalae]|uniref:uncharacterized protein n=1 Tax=Sporobolomyces koalae TaxID=500713 RepID=UPI003181D617